jgi:hypothetical protein
MVTVAENNGGFSVWRRSVAERLRLVRPNGEGEARISEVEGLLAELRQRRAGLEATIADAATKEETYASEGRDLLRYCEGACWRRPGSMGSRPSGRRREGAA